MKAKKGKFFNRGAHVKDYKYLACDNPIEVLEAPDIVSIALGQHIGKPSECVRSKLHRQNAAGAVFQWYCQG